MDTKHETAKEMYYERTEYCQKKSERMHKQTCMYEN